MTDTHYFYKTINLVNGKFYYGVTNGNDPWYYGSGKALKDAIKKYGIKNFHRCNLKTFNTSEEAYLEEARVVTEKLVEDRQCYNMKIGGWGGVGQKKTEEHRKKISESVKKNYQDNPHTHITNGGRKPKYENLIELYDKHGKIECAKMLDEDPQNLYHQYRRAKKTLESKIL